MREATESQLSHLILPLPSLERPKFDEPGKLTRLGKRQIHKNKPIKIFVFMNRLISFVSAMNSR